MAYYISKTVTGSFNEVHAKVTNQLKELGFGVITEVKMEEKFKEKLGKDFKKYAILGVCNPGFAYEAIQKEDKLGVLLPCNVVVIDQPGDKIEVAAINANEMMKGLDNKALDSIADEVGQNLQKALDRL